VGIDQLFFARFRQNIDSFAVTGGGLPCGAQNIDSMGLAGKIFRNKDLDTAAGLIR
jgi:hypothetical protein